MKRVGHYLHKASVQALVEAVRDPRQVSQYTHDFYRYPARFSPYFARSVIHTFSDIGDVILDPFMGGGTSLVESLIARRRVIGIDISDLSLFITKVKTTPLSECDLSCVVDYLETTVSELNVHHRIEEEKFNSIFLHHNVPWQYRRAIEILVSALEELRWQKQRDFARAIILKTAQWALDCKVKTPSISRFREKLRLDSRSMVEGMREYTNSYKDKYGSIRGIKHVRRLIKIPIENINPASLKNFGRKPKLVITSPPYPGVHVLYHRWQINGRRETNAPFWISDCSDGHTESHYTFCNRQQEGLPTYFERAEAAFSSIRRLVAKDAIVVQLVGFTNPAKYLRRYLRMMEAAGFEELDCQLPGRNGRTRLWRDVPNRKWYADAKGRLSSSREVVLIHRVG